MSGSKPQNGQKATLFLQRLRRFFVTVGVSASILLSQRLKTKNFPCASRNFVSEEDSPFFSKRVASTSPSHHRISHISLKSGTWRKSRGERFQCKQAKAPRAWNLQPYSVLQRDLSSQGGGFQKFPLYKRKALSPFFHFCPMPHQGR